MSHNRDYTEVRLIRDLILGGRFGTYKDYPLPERQTSGTLTQRCTYAQNKAEEFYDRFLRKSKGFTNLEENTGVLIKEFGLVSFILEGGEPITIKLPEDLDIFAKGTFVTSDREVFEWYFSDRKGNDVGPTLSLELLPPTFEYQLFNDIFSEDGSEKINIRIIRIL